mgnify:CR=1 FL=1
MNSAKKIPSPLVSLFPIAFLVGMLFATIHTFGSDALSGGSQWYVCLYRHDFLPHPLERL